MSEAGEGASTGATVSVTATMERAVVPSVTNDIPVTIEAGDSGEPIDPTKASIDYGQRRRVGLYSALTLVGVAASAGAAASGNWWMLAGSVPFTIGSARLSLEGLKLGKHGRTL